MPAIPSTLPPSVEEAYRRKCVQLKNRTNEVEEANDAARLRLARIKRQVEKMRVERAFLLEQLAKRTSANVEDSDGSPSPPPTVCIPSFPDHIAPPSAPGNASIPAYRASLLHGARFNVDAFALGLGLPIQHTQ
jgi:non-histone protein 10